MICPIPIEPRWLLFIRLTCFGCFLATALEINLRSVGFFCLTIASLYGFRKSTSGQIVRVREVDLNKLANNPFKNVKKENEIPESLLNKSKNELFNCYFSDFADTESIRRFAPLKNNSDCLFAKRSKLWGAEAWNTNLSIRQNIQHNVIPSFILFSNAHIHLNLDGYLIQLPGDIYGREINKFAKCFHTVLTMLASFDPSGRNCMASEIDSPKWVFEFNRTTFFITTFAPFYPQNHPRYSHQVDECFILFQPEISFARHNLPPDTPNTDWSQPKNIREKIRVQFRDAGRSYLIRDSVNYPMSHDIIRPIDNCSDPVQWWKLVE